MAIDRDALVVALKAAKRVGQSVSEALPDSGTCNFDAPVLVLPGMRESVIEAICKEAGLDCYKWRPGYWVITGCTQGQGNDRTQGAEAACRVLETAGFKTTMYYQMD